MKNAKLFSLVLVGLIFGFALVGCNMDNVPQNEVLPDIRGDWRITTMGGKNSVAQLQMNSTTVWYGAAKGYGEWGDEGTYTYDKHHITFNLKNNGSTTYRYFLGKSIGHEDLEDGTDILEIRYISGDGRKLFESVYYKERPINW